ncbi:hypothetical protein LguiB_032615 [Lonicera macranthoides]
MKSSPSSITVCLLILMLLFHLSILTTSSTQTLELSSGHYINDAQYCAIETRGESNNDSNNIFVWNESVLNIQRILVNEYKRRQRRNMIREATPEEVPPRDPLLPLFFLNEVEETPPLISLISRHLPVIHFSPPQSSTVFHSPHSGSNERHRSTLLTAIAVGLPSLSPLLGLIVLNRFPLSSFRLKRTPPFYSPHCHRCRTAVAFPSTRSYRPPLISLISRHLPVLHFSPPQSSTVFPSPHSGSNERHRSTLLTAIAAGLPPPLISLISRHLPVIHFSPPQSSTVFHSPHSGSNERHRSTLLTAIAAGLPSLSPLLGLIGSKRKVTMNTIHETFKDYKYVNVDLDIMTKRAALRASASVVGLISRPRAGGETLFKASGTIYETTENGDGRYLSSVVTSASLVGSSGEDVDIKMILLEAGVE